jgi:hypothetical protein
VALLRPTASFVRIDRSPLLVVFGRAGAILRERLSIVGSPQAIRELTSIAMYRYFPSLLSLPVLLVVGIVFVVVPGGFIVVFAGAYYAAMGVIGYGSLRVRGRRQAARALAHQPNRRSSRQPGIRAPTPAAAVFRTLPGRQTVNRELEPVDDHVLARRHTL